MLVEEWSRLRRGFATGVVRFSHLSGRWGFLFLDSSLDEESLGSERSWERRGRVLGGTPLPGVTGVAGRSGQTIVGARMVSANPPAHRGGTRRDAGSSRRPSHDPWRSSWLQVDVGVLLFFSPVTHSHTHTDTDTTHRHTIWMRRLTVHRDQ